MRAMITPKAGWWLGWHLSGGTLGFKHGRRNHVKIETGATFRVRGDLKMCRFGLHASQKPLDALNYAKGNIASRVRLFGKRIDQDDKSCATHRTHLWVADAEKTLFEFACWCAETALRRCQEKGINTDERSWAAIRARRLWLEGKITDEEWAAARAAARAAAGAAARAAAGAAAGAAARAAAWDAARDAARAAARAAAWDAAWEEQNAKLHEMFMTLAPGGYDECER